jgi:hypothetical protein
MVKISSGSTTFYKKIFPVIWFGFLALFVARSALRGGLEEARLPFVVMPSS